MSKAGPVKIKSSSAIPNSSKQITVGLGVMVGCGAGITVTG